MPKLTTRAIRARWTLTHERATHDSGVIVHLPSGRIETDGATIERMRAQHGQGNIPAMLGRLRREAMALAGIQLPTGDNKQ